MALAFSQRALGLGIAVLPESPRWLLLHRHKEEALKVLSWIRQPKEVTPEVNDILEHPESGHGKLADLRDGNPWRVGRYSPADRVPEDLSACAGL